jgi:hypothetical protein
MVTISIVEVKILTDGKEMIRTKVMISNTKNCRYLGYHLANNRNYDPQINYRGLIVSTKQLMNETQLQTVPKFYKEIAAPSLLHCSECWT